MFAWVSRAVSGSGASEINAHLHGLTTIPLHPRAQCWGTMRDAREWFCRCEINAHLRAASPCRVANIESGRAGGNMWGFHQTLECGRLFRSHRNRICLLCVASGCGSASPSAQAFRSCATPGHTALLAMARDMARDELLRAHGVASGGCLPILVHERLAKRRADAGPAARA